MFTRATGWLIVPLWLASVVWLIAHDVWPDLTATDPPPMRVTDWLKTEGRQSEFSMLLSGEPIGRIWTSYLIGDNSLRRTDVVWVYRFPIAVAPLRIIADSVFTGEGVLDELTVHLATEQESMHLHGERFHSAFSFEFESGTMDQAFTVPLVDGGLISAAMSPFTQLSDLQVGQTWRMQIFNPIAALTGVGDRFMPMLVKVTGKEHISTPSGDRECLVLESARAKAWVDENGAVLAQEITLPMPGKLRIVRQNSYNEDALAEVRRKPLGGG